MPCLDRLGHPAGLLGLGDVRPGPLGEVVGEPLDVVAAGPRVDDVRRPALLLEQELGVAGDPRREVRRQCDRLVEGVGVQRLGVPLRGGHRLDAGPADVVVDVLRGERPAGGLRVRAQRQRLGVRGVELAHQLGPQRPGGPQLGDLHEEVHADRPEEAQPRGERVDVEPGGQAGADVLDAVGQRVRQLEVGRRSGLLHVVAGDRDRVEARHVRRGVAEDVGDDPHARQRRVDVGVADHELLEDVVLDGPGEVLGLHALLLGRHDVERHDRQHGAVHRHRDAHLVQRDPLEEGASVVDGVDRHPGHADVAAHAGVVGVVAAVGRQVEGDAEPLLTGGEVAAVERVGLLGGREAGVLPDRPRLGGVHRRVGAAQERLEARPRVECVETLQVGRVVRRLDRDALGRLPRSPAIARGASGGTAGERQSGERAGDGHDSASRVRWRKASASTPIAQESSSRSGGIVRSPGFPARITRAAPAARSAATRSEPHSA